MAGSLYLGNQKVCPAIVIGDGSKAYNVDGYDIFGEPNENGVWQKPNTDIQLVFDGIKKLEQPVNAYTDTLVAAIINLSSKFCQRITSISFPDLEECEKQALYNDNGDIFINITNYNFNKLRIVGKEGLVSFCRSSKITNLEFPSLTTVGQYSLEAILTKSSVETVKFQSLENIGDESLSYAFFRCNNLKDVYFYAIKSNSFAGNTNSFDSMLVMTTGVTLHFPTNVSSVIATLDGYPNFGGTDVTILFDLPATE